MKQEVTNGTRGNQLHWKLPKGAGMQFQTAVAQKNPATDRA